ncbi:MAG TPA: phosphatase PAP2 family protein [Bacteroidales bacterium]
MNALNNKNKDLSAKAKITVILFSALYLLVISLLVGLRIEHWLILGLYNLCIFISSKTRKLILAFTIFLVFGILYDLMKAYPNYQVNHIDISSLYHFEQKLFGLTANGRLFTPNEFFALHHNTFLDVLSGLFYINWMPVPLAVALYLYLKNKQQFLYFSLTFFLINLLGFCIYYLHPAAPPWYVDLYGFNINKGVPGNAAGLSRFDNLLHIPVFESIYSRNSNVFAALPSLHSAYPVVVLYYGIKNRLGRINVLLGLFMIGIWFSAVYSGHHYVTDVLSGIICACLGILLFEKVLLNNTIFKKWVDKYTLLIS